MCPQGGREGLPGPWGLSDPVFIFKFSTSGVKGRVGLCGFFFFVRLHILKIYINQYLAITYNGKESEKEYIYIYIYIKN